MIGDRLNLAHNTINDRLQSEIVDLLKAIESRLNFKNPADLVGDKEMPTPELLAWAWCSSGRSQPAVWLFEAVSVQYQPDLPPTERRKV
jgi:hypothetical protein